MTGRLAIWFCVLITIVHVARCSNTCCANNESILLSQKCDNSIDEPNPQCIDGEEPVLLCANGEKLSLQCNDGKIIFLDGNVTEDSFTVDDTTNNLVYENDEFDPFRYCINGMINDNKEYHEIAIVCIEDEPSIFLVIVFAALEIITIVFLLFIIVIYLALPELQDLQGKCILHFLINYAVLYLISDTLHRHDSLLCVVKAYSFYFFSICAFCWLCISSFNIWRASITKNMEDSHTYFLYVIYGYGLPAIMLFLMLFIQLIPGNHMKPNFENYNCWFKDYISRWWYYYLPIAILSLAGTYFLVNSSKHLKKNRHSRIHIHRIKALQARCWLYSKLYVVVVLTWICEILHNEFFPSFQPLIFFTDILNCTQGFFIFVILIATRNKVRKILAQRKPCGINCFPNSWITAMDMESEEENRNRYHNAANMEFIEIPLKTMNRGV